MYIHYIHVCIIGIFYIKHVNVCIIHIYANMCMHAQMLSCLALSNSSATPWTVAHLAPLSKELLRQAYWSGLPFPSPGDLSDPGIKPASLVFPALSGRFFSTNVTWEALPLSNHPQMDHLFKK